MSEIKLTSIAEKKAEQAENLNAYSGIKLLHIKKQVALILAQIGREGIFDEYTKHDISHINYMLDSLEWIIPKETQDIMTPSEWLMITLAIYFHDLGMLVTKDEFKERNNTSFKTYKQSIIDGKFGLDFKEKIFNLEGLEKQDRFIYQEFVRRTHAERIKFWIIEENNPIYPKELAIVVEIKKLISNADNMFRRDLALICESHHLSDLEDFDKYKPDQQYGPTKNEKVNLHYCALILRTADLLHITSDRTPSIEFNLINPSDPISQEEWAKQKSVKTVRIKIKKNIDGQIDETIIQDTLEVIALFEQDKGFFGLISYVNYSNSQLKENFRLNELANKTYGYNYSYPWKKIDDSSIETKDFEKKQFEFILDQTKILDLLIGHTLYNDSSVVLRELTQNGIDASKLKKYELDNIGTNNYEPEIKISWKSKERELCFMDNGTGMTLEIIQNHLLKVGSSRYQDENFIKNNPDFSSISRFGIGLLTCFLIANDIDIITKSSEADKAILLRIKKIHGKYLLKYLTIDKLPNEIKEHGTIIKLYVRSEVKLNNIENDLKKWILFPDCKMTFDNNGEKINIGYKKPSDLLKEYLEKSGYDFSDKNLKIKEVYHKGVTLAFALKYVEHWKEWNFLDYDESPREKSLPIGTCVEGIRVDFNTPGFRGRNLFAIVNSTGKGAPKTNVARSNIEITPEKAALLSTIYDLYLQHISDEMDNLIKQGFSITWAATEGNWLLESFSQTRRYGRRNNMFEDSEIFEKSLSNIKCILIENNDIRELKSFNELKNINHFWTIDCASYSSADSLIKEVKSSNTSALSLLQSIFGEKESNIEHIDNLLCNNQSVKNIDVLISKNFQVNSIKIIPSQRRLDLKWSLTDEKIWEEINLTDNEDERYNRGVNSKCYIQLIDFEIDESINQTAINSSNALFILKNSALNTYLVKLVKKLSDNSQEDKIALVQIVSLLNTFFNHKNLDKTKIEDLIESRFERNNNRDLSKIVWSRIDKEELISTILKTDFIKYDTTIWYRRLMH
ncbi:ATP-binding protein [uncultured Lacinutrix sp.]|uniref:HD domain-containing protein n=1 Tax=uncultured Lacinutrix sp. TaxID=574032 RepID=UPI002614EEB0|nr:ATP-binding protein [uncultured Lacinutrix sp.]